MANTPLINARVNITCKDINGNSVAKQFNSVQKINFDYNEGTVFILDETGPFYFGLTTITSLTYTVISGYNGVTTVVMS